MTVRSTPSLRRSLRKGPACAIPRKVAPSGHGVFPLDPKSLLARHDLTPKRSFGQNFLADEHLAYRIAELAVPEPRGGVVEIGAGLGALIVGLL